MKTIKPQTHNFIQQLLLLKIVQYQIYSLDLYFFACISLDMGTITLSLIIIVINIQCKIKCFRNVNVTHSLHLIIDHNSL